MNVLSLFAGIGGLDLGLEWAGFRTIAFVERDPSCQHWLSKHWPGVPIHGDIHTFSGVPLRGLVDLVCGGFPCQPFSVAGKQKGTEDERHLWPEMSRVIREVRPRWVLAENVPGLRTIAADLVLEDLEGQGYTCWPLVVGVDDVGGPHRRKRVWIVGRLGLADSDGARERDADELWRIEWASRAGEADAGRSGEALAHRDGGRCEGERGSGLLDGEREAFGDHADGRGVWPVGEPTGEGLEGLRPDAREPQESESRDSGARMADPESHRLERRPTRTRPEARPTTRARGVHRWPARPGEPQHPWEAPRLAHTERGRRDRRQGATDRDEFDGSDAGRLQGNGESSGGHSPEGRGVSGSRSEVSSEPSRSPGQPRQDPDPREPESPMGGAASGISGGLAGLSSSHRREALKALGNAVSPPCAYYIGRAIRSIEERL